MRKLLVQSFLCIAALGWANSAALAQSSPNLQTGQVPTAAQWNSYFAAKTDYFPGGLPVSRGGTGALDAATARLNLGIASPADLTTALPSGSTSTLYGGTGGAGVARVITLGTGLSMAGSTLNSTASGTGTVTNVSGVNANGVTVVVANATTTPAITVGTSITGVVKGAAGALATATNADLPAMTSTVGGAVPTPPNNTTQFLRADGTWSTPSGTGIGTVTSFAFSNNNGFVGIVSNPTSTPSLTISTTLNGVLKGTGAGMAVATNADLPVMTSTVRGAVPTPPNNTTTFLRGDGTWAVPAATGGGTVTTLSVVTGNGFGGSVANATTTPAITLSTPLSGVLKGTGTAMVAATSGVDFSAGTGGLGTGIIKSTTGSGALSIAVGNDLPEMSATVRGAVPTPPNDVTKFLAGNGTWQTPGGGSGISGLSATGQALTYQKAVSGNAIVFSGVISSSTLTVSSFAGGRPIIIGDTIVGAGVVNGTRIIAFGSGSGGNGTYTINQAQSIGAEAMSIPNYDQVALVVQNDNPGMFSSVNATYGSTGSWLNYSQININGSYVYPAAEANNGFGGFLNFITRNIGGTPLQAAFLNGGLIGTTVGAERGDLDLGIYGHSVSGMGINVPRVIGLRADADGRLRLAVDADGQWDLGGPTPDYARWGNAYFSGTVTAGTFAGTVPVSSLNSGSGATSSTFWRGDGTWANPSSTLLASANTWSAGNTFNGVFSDVAYPGGFSASAAKLTRSAPTGGAATVRAASFVGTTTQASTAAFEWNQLSYLNNFATAGENVAFAAQAYKQSTGATWAGLFEAHDTTEVANPVNAMYGMELDVSANGTDSGNKRFGIIVVGVRQNRSGAVNEISNGIWVGGDGTDPGGVKFTSGINISSEGYLGLNLSGAFTGAAISVNNPAGTPTIIDASASGNIGGLFNVSSSNTVFSSAPLGSYFGKVAIKVDGGVKWVPLYN